jgi:hypothetical protein
MNASSRVLSIFAWSMLELFSYQNVSDAFCKHHINCPSAAQLPTSDVPYGRKNHEE